MIGEPIPIQGESRRWNRRAWAKRFSISFCQRMWASKLRWFFFSGPSDKWDWKPASNLPDHLKNFGDFR